MRGLLSLLWHEPTGKARNVAVLMMGGAMGGTLGPGDSLYHQVGELLAQQGVPSIRMSYRKPNDMDRCCIDAAAAVQLLVGSGADSVVLMGHSFGGAVAVLPVEASEVVKAMAGTGDLHVMPGDDHLLAKSHDAMLEIVVPWLNTVFEGVGSK